MVAQIQKLLKTQPFVPFTVVMSNGDRHQVRHPEHALLTKHFFIVVDADNEEATTHLYMLHVAELVIDKTVVA